MRPAKGRINASTYRAAPPTTVFHRGPPRNWSNEWFSKNRTTNRAGKRRNWSGPADQIDAPIGTR